MATKKTTTKKAPATKKAPTKATKATPRAKTVSKKVTKPVKANASRSRLVAVRKEQEDFMTFRVNRETIYWAVLGAVVILFAMWIMQLQADIEKLYDEIDASTAASDVLDMEMVKKN